MGTSGWEILPILNNFAAPRQFARLPCFMMDTPVRNKDFFGRESTLQMLDDSLLPSEDLTFSSESDSQKYVVLCGMGGLGKTSIAMEFAFRRRDKFDAVFWIRADEVSKLEQGSSCRGKTHLCVFVVMLYRFQSNRFEIGARKCF